MSVRVMDEILSGWSGYLHTPGDWRHGSANTHTRLPWTWVSPEPSSGGSHCRYHAFCRGLPRVCKRTHTLDKTPLKWQCTAVSWELTSMTVMFCKTRSRCHVQNRPRPKRCTWCVSQVSEVPSTHNCADMDSYWQAKRCYHTRLRTWRKTMARKASFGTWLLVY